LTVVEGIGIKIGRIAIILAVFPLWELMSRTGLVNPRLLPSASETLATLFDQLQRTSIRGDLAATALEVMTAFVLAVPTGCLIGFLIAENRYVADVAKPLLFFAFSIPKSIFLPMFILVFGIGFQQKVAYAAFTTAFVVLMSATAAVESVRADHIMVARSFGATKVQILRRVYVPSMLPILLEALRIAMIFNFTGVMIAEMYASRTGIGHLIANWGENFQMPQLFAGVIVLAAVAILFNEAVRALESRCSTWRT
jgi:ABC-type nitrate/sulfonate/bicarbonate transport system permease component